METNLHLIARLERKTEEHLTFAINTIQNLSDDVLLKPASHGGWSIAQCLDHLNRYGHYYLPQILSAIEKSSSVSPEKQFTNGWLGNYFTNTMDPRLGKTFNAFKEYIPERELNAHAVAAAFIHQQELLLHYLAKAVKKDLSIRIPISISTMVKLKLGDIFQFVIMHNERHMLQAKRNLVP